MELPRVEAGVTWQWPIASSTSACVGVIAGYQFVMSGFEATPRVTACREGLGGMLSNTYYGVDLRLSKRWRLGRATTGVQTELGAAVLQEGGLYGERDISSYTYGGGAFEEIALGGKFGLHLGLEVNGFSLSGSHLTWPIRAIAAVTLAP